MRWGRSWRHRHRRWQAARRLGGHHRWPYSQWAQVIGRRVRSHWVHSEVTEGHAVTSWEDTSTDQHPPPPLILHCVTPLPLPCAQATIWPAASTGAAPSPSCSSSRCRGCWRRWPSRCRHCWTAGMYASPQRWGRVWVRGGPVAEVGMSRGLRMQLPYAPDLPVPEHCLHVTPPLDIREAGSLSPGGPARAHCPIHAGTHVAEDVLRLVAVHESSLSRYAVGLQHMQRRQQVRGSTEKRKQRRECFMGFDGHLNPAPPRGLKG